MIRVCAAAALAVALFACQTPAPTAPEVAPEVAVAPGPLAEVPFDAPQSIFNTDLGDSCNDGSKLTLCDTDNGSSWPDSHDDGDFTITLEFNKKVLIHPRTLLGRHGIFRVTNGTITEARAIGDVTSVELWIGFSQPRSKKWELIVSPREGYDVKLFYPKRSCSHRKVICTDKWTLQNQGKPPHNPIVEIPLDHRIRIVIPWKEMSAVVDPPTEEVIKVPKVPGPVRDIRIYGRTVGWQAPATHGKSLITEYRIFSGDCNGYRIKTLRHPRDFTRHVGHDGRYWTHLGIRPSSVGVSAVNSSGAGPCVVGE